MGFNSGFKGLIFARVCRSVLATFTRVVCHHGLFGIRVFGQRHGNQSVQTELSKLSCVNDAVWNNFSGTYPRFAFFLKLSFFIKMYH